MDTPNPYMGSTLAPTSGGMSIATPLTARDGILDPALRERMHLMDADLRDDEDYTRRVFTAPTGKGATVASESEASSNPKGSSRAKVLGVRNPDLVDSVDSDLGRQSWTPRAL